MQKTSENLEVHSVGVKSSTQFTVASNAKVMRLLSDSLYSDKVSAIVRELSTNAIDSHIAANIISKPFVIHLPTSDKPTFSIRDFGEGLSLDNLTKLYTTYGASDKDNNNAYVGMMGLGSKSPFALVDSFNVTSYYHGQKYICICGRNSDGIPTLNVMEILPTQEKNGLEINFVVSQNHHADFSEAASKIYRTFPTLPTIKNGKLNIDSPPIVLSGNGWRILERRLDNSIAIMGYVQYPIEAKYFSKTYRANEDYWSKYYIDSRDNIEAQLLNIGLEIDFPIGSIDVDIGRERLSYNTTTINTIKARLADVFSELKEIISAKITSCSTLWEAQCLYRKLITGALGYMEDISSILDVKWNGFSLSKSIRPTISKHSSLSVVIANYGKISTQNTHNFVILPNINDLFYVNDIKRGAYALAKSHSLEKNCKIYLLTFKNVEDSETIKQEFISQLGITESQLVYVSTLKNKIRATSDYKRGPTKQFEFVACSTHKSIATSYWKEVNIDYEKNNGYYVALSGQNNIFMQNKDSILISRILHNEDLEAITRCLSDIGVVLDMPLYGVRPSHIKYIQNRGGWIDFFEFAKQKVLAREKELTISSTLEDIAQHYELSYKKTLLEFNKISLSSILSPSSIFATFLRKYHQIHQDKIKFELVLTRLNTLRGSLGIDTNTNSNMASYNLMNAYDKLQSHYPMLNFVTYDITCSSDANIQKIINYVNLVDGSI